jgi:hypothetical protein
MSIQDDATGYLFIAFLLGCAFGDWLIMRWLQHHTAKLRAKREHEDALRDVRRTAFEE